MDTPLHVLIVEDSEDDAMLLVRELRQGGYDPFFEIVDAEETMAAALEKCKWDIIISDYVMPHFSGLEALKLVQKKELDIPFIIVSGRIGEDIAVEAMKAGAHDYIMKCNLTRLTPAVERELREACVRRERRHAERSLKESEDTHRRLVEFSPYAIIINCDGKFDFLNTAGARLFGAEKPEELIGKPIFQFVHPDYREIVWERMKRVQEEGIVEPLAERKFIRLDGTVVDVEAGSIPFIYKGEQAALGIAIDITERKRAEEISLENQRLAYANKVKSEFLASVSHDIRTPLNAIIGFSELLKQKLAGELNEKQAHYVDNVITSGRFLLSLINNILDLAKIEAGKMELTVETFSVHEAINETLTLIKEKAAKHNIVLKKEFDSSLNFIEADQQKFKQILFNLLSNAVKFSKEEGGTVTVTTRLIQDMAQISVSDTGVGIKEEDMGKLFIKFQQLDSVRKNGGTGLGLVISKQLVDLHGGKIMMESKYGEGSNFTFFLPLKAKKQEVR